MKLSRIFLLTRLLVHGGDATLNLQQISQRRAKAVQNKKGKGEWAATREKKTGKGSLIVLAFAGIYLFFVMFMLGFALTKPLYDRGNHEILLRFLIPLHALAIVFLGFFSLVSTLYHSKNTALVLTLPFRTEEIFLARYIQNWLLLSLANLFFALPLYLAYGIFSQQVFAYYPALSIYLLASPLLMLAPMTLLILLFMRFTKAFRNKERFTLVSIILILVLSLGLALFFSRGSDVFEHFTLAKADRSGLEGLFWVFPGLGAALTWLTQVATLNGWLFGLLFLLACVGALALLVLASQRLYLKALMSMGTSPGKAKKLSRKQLGAFNRSQSPFFALMQYENRKLLRTPAYLLNNVVGSFLMPLILGIMMLVIARSDQMDLRPAVTRAWFHSFMIDPQGRGLAELILLLVFVNVASMMSSTNALAASAVSREGASAVMMKQYPYPFIKQLGAKFTVALIYSLATPLILLMALPLFLAPSPGLFVAIAINLFLAVLLNNLIGLWVDMMWPKLAWQDEQQAVKQNLNVLAELFGSMLVTGSGLGLAAVSYFLFHAGLSVISLVLIVYLSAFALFFAYLIRRTVPHCLNRIAS